MTETQRLIAECRRWAQGLREHPLVDVAGTNFRDRAALLDRIVDEIERLQEDAARIDALQEITQTNGYVGLWQYDVESWQIKAGSRDIPQSTGGLRGVLDNLRQWMAEDKAEREADR